MAKVELPPEAADGGFWYVVTVIPDLAEGGRTVDVPGGWCAWYGEGDLEGYAAVRTRDLVIGASTSEATIGAVLASCFKTAGAKPRGRIRGR